ncbi:hypothetical protein CLV32_4223 [Pedobacter duraquae]|uniref:Uncharacterized protein n=1 Tax=Pedobacter duraquae TaxID=425511 RepID=A0A4R6IDA3_9SPHI|nr:hypothetical protein CLV32_4223 [Pedobacter duraquae]
MTTQVGITPILSRFLSKIVIFDVREMNAIQLYTYVE